jgi:hypothetical protein
MKFSYLIAGLIFIVGVWLVSFGMSSAPEMSLLGVTFHPRVAKGVGIIAVIFSLIALLAIWGSSQTPTRAERRG